MRLHLEEAQLPVADVDHPGSGRALDDLRPLGRQLAQVKARGLVRAMLVPHRRDDAEAVKVGVRPISATRRASSSGLRPWRRRAFR